MGWWLVPLFVVSGILLIAGVSFWLGWHPWVGPSTGPPPFFWPIFPLGFLLLLFLGFFLFRWVVWGGRGWAGPGGWNAVSAREVLRLRFARGELTTEQFRQMSRELEAPSPR